LFETAVDVAAGLSEKRDITTSYSASETDAFLDSKVSEATYQSQISFKNRDKGGLLHE